MELVVLVRVVGASSAADGGVIDTVMLNYELRNRSSGTTIARVNVAADKAVSGQDLETETSV